MPGELPFFLGRIVPHLLGVLSFLLRYCHICWGLLFLLWGSSFVQGLLFCKGFLHLSGWEGSFIFISQVASIFERRLLYILAGGLPHLSGGFIGQQSSIFSGEASYVPFFLYGLHICEGASVSARGLLHLPKASVFSGADGLTHLPGGFCSCWNLPNLL